MARKLFSFIFCILIIMTLCSCELMTKEPSKGVLRVFAYGNNYYNYQEGFGRLDTCENDAKFFVETIDKLYEKSNGRTYSSCELTLLTSVDDSTESRTKGSKYEMDSPYSLETIPTTLVDAFYYMIDAYTGPSKIPVSENDTFIFYFSGHGANTKNSLNMYVPYGEEAYNYSKIVLGYDSNEKGLLSMEELREYLKYIPGRKIVVLDSCFSGGFNFGDGLTVNQTTWPDDSINVFKLYSDPDSVNVDQDIYALTAARYFEESWSMKDKGVSEFTDKLFDAVGFDRGTQSLKESIPSLRDGKITLQSIFGYIREYYDGKCGNGSRDPYGTSSGGSMDTVLFDI